jgi:hypothetical protein
MAVPAAANIVITRGDTTTLSIALTTNGTSPLDITGRTYTAQVRGNSEDTSAEVAFTCTLSATPNDGILTCVLTATQTATLEPGNHVWDLQENASGVISTILSGTFTVLADITR